MVKWMDYNWGMEIGEKPVEASWADIQIAKFINDLVSKQIIDPVRIRKADEVIMGELIKRFEEQIGKFGYIDKKQAKFIRFPRKLKRKLRLYWEVEKDEAVNQ